MQMDQNGKKNPILIMPNIIITANLTSKTAREWHQARHHVN